LEEEPYLFTIKLIVGTDKTQPSCICYVTTGWRFAFKFLSYSSPLALKTPLSHIQDPFIPFEFPFQRKQSENSPQMFSDKLRSVTHVLAKACTEWRVEDTCRFSPFGARS